MPVPEFLQPWLGSGPPAARIFYGVALALVLALLLALWLLLGRGPRRRRAYRRAQQLLGQGNWSGALQMARALRPQCQNVPRWRTSLDRLEGECHRAGGEAALQEQKYEASLEHFGRAARLLRHDEAEDRAYVIQAMLAEVRRLLAANSVAEPAVHKLISRILTVQSPCPEASFWQGICHLRTGNAEPALAALQQARGGDIPADGAAPRPLPPDAAIDPSLYLGAVLLRAGRPEEALRYLAEANRLDANCPFVTWQLATAMLAAGGDTLIAVRALQRALGPRGLQLWVKSPQRAWVEGFPEKRSFVRRLAAKQAFACPVFGSDVGYMIRQGQISLGQGQYRLGNFEESAKVFHQVLQEGAPSLPVLRGLGLALARLGRFDEAFKHLRAAHEMEDPKDFLTAGYLALCGARGKPTRPEDRPRNVLWAVKLAGRFHVPGNTEWAAIASQVFAEARALSLSVPVDDQVRLCDVLVSVDAADPLAAGAYGHLAATLLDRQSRTQGEEEAPPDGEVTLPPCHLVTLSPEPFRPEYAWLYCRAAQQHGPAAACDLELFALTFATEAEARRFYGQRRWDLDEVEYAYLEHAAARQPGGFPAALGPDYPARGERLLLARSEWLEGSSDAEGAVAAVDVLLNLAPHSTKAHDRRAQLAYRAQDLDRAAAHLESWHALAPDDPVPLLRRAVIEQRRGNPARRAAAVGQALRLAKGRARADAAFLGARLALQDWLASAGQEEEGHRNGDGMKAGGLLPAETGRSVLDLLDECLREHPEHEGALWCRAALLCVLGRTDELAAQAPAMRRLEEKWDPLDGRFFFFAAVCHLAAGDYARVLDCAGRAAAPSPALGPEWAYLRGWAHYLLGDADAAVQALQQPATDSAAAANAHAKALLGRICFAGGASNRAVAWWKALDPARRKEWGLDDPLRLTLLASALQGFQEDRFEEAAEQLREAGRLGLRDRRLGPLLAFALTRAGQRLLYLEV